MPEAGKTKTRLIPILGEKGAAALCACMTGIAVRTARKFRQLAGADIEICHNGGKAFAFQRWLGRDLDCFRQRSTDLGKNMAHDFNRLFAAGYEKVIIIGSDCPSITPRLLNEASRQLNNNDLVLGPAYDGGYYLVGLSAGRDSATIQALFSNTPWGTDSVARTTMTNAENLNMSWSLISCLHDIDRPGDIKYYGQAAEKHAGQKITVVIPAMNEENTIRSAINSVLDSRNVDVILADGGSRDRTVLLARAAGAVISEGARGRGPQMNLGAIHAKAQSAILLFLHADTILPDGWDNMVRTVLAAPGIIGGAFELGIKTRSRSMRIIEKGANLRSRVFNMAYGDQAIFVRHDIFMQIGGFPDYPLMEDYEFVRRIRRSGRFAILPFKVQTSPRRWIESGVFRTTAINYACILGYRFGISTKRLAGFYRKRRT